MTLIEIHKCRIEWLDDNGETHNDSGPAIKARYTLQWFNHGKLHNEKGPAYVFCDYETNGRFYGKLPYWYLKGVELNEEEFNRLTK
jgi:hypothetical protein